MKVIHISDIHIKNSIDKDRPIDVMLENAVKAIYNEIKDDNPDDVRIIMVGDIFHNKTKASNEAKSMFHTFLNYINELGVQTIIIAGNHDLIVGNKNVMDSISPTFDINGVYENITYADMELDYKSGTIIDDDAKIIWAVYSIIDKYKRPEIEIAKKQHPDYTVVGLYHGDLIGGTTATGRVVEDAIPFSDFMGCDCVMCGHIHLHQEIKQEGIKFVYPGSLFQQNAGENITGHGFVVWNLDNLEYKLVEVDNDYRIFRVVLDSYDDISDDKEELINL